jgi:CubicO group peptidase (beta-lactamase class C family)
LSTESVKIRSRWWYLLPIFLNIIGGVIAYFVLRKDDHIKAKRTLILGIILLGVVAVLGVAIVYLEFYITSHQLPLAGEEFQLSDAVKEVIRENVDNGKHQALFVGMIDENGVQQYYYGHTANGENAIDENTIFEIGSVSKVFTSLLLADMVEKGEVSLNDPIDKFLPEYVSAPTKNDKKITLLDLATHSSGLPRWPDGFPVLDAQEQFEYDREEMYDYLSNVELTREIGSEYSYSNIGVSLLGHILSLQAGQSYEELLKDRVLDKFEMESTCVKSCDALRDRFATPHLLGFQFNPINLSDDMAGAGEIRSSGKDMLTFLSYAMGLKDSDLKSSFELTQKVNRQIDDQLSIGLAWHMTQKDDRMIVWHNGATNGFTSFVGFDPELNQGVVVLSNSLIIVDDVGYWLLEHGHTS